MSYQHNGNGGSARFVNGVGAGMGASMGGVSSSSAPVPDVPLGPLDDSRKFFLANMAFTFTAQEVKTWFGRFGVVNHCKIVYDKSGKSKGYGFLYMHTAEGSQAVENFANSHSHKITMLGRHNVHCQKNDEARVKDRRDEGHLSAGGVGGRISSKGYSGARNYNSANVTNTATGAVANANLGISHMAGPGGGAAANLSHYGPASNSHGSSTVSPHNVNHQRQSYSIPTTALPNQSYNSSTPTPTHAPTTTTSHTYPPHQAAPNTFSATGPPQGSAPSVVTSDYSTYQDQQQRAPPPLQSVTTNGVNVPVSSSVDYSQPNLTSAPAAHGSYNTNGQTQVSTAPPPTNSYAQQQPMQALQQPMQAQQQPPQPYNPVPQGAHTNLHPPQQQQQQQQHQGYYSTTGPGANNYTTYQQQSSLPPPNIVSAVGSNDPYAQSAPPPPPQHASYQHIPVSQHQQQYNYNPSQPPLQQQNDPTQQQQQPTPNSNTHNLSYVVPPPAPSYTQTNPIPQQQPQQQQQQNPPPPPARPGPNLTKILISNVPTTIQPSDLVSYLVKTWSKTPRRCTLEYDLKSGTNLAHVDFHSVADANEVIGLAQSGKMIFRGFALGASVDWNPPPDGVHVPIGSGAPVTSTTIGGVPGGSTGGVVTYSNVGVGSGASVGGNGSFPRRGGGGRGGRGGRGSGGGQGSGNNRYRPY